MNQPMRKPLETAQNLTETGMPRDAADIVVGAIHDVRDELVENQAASERRTDQKFADMMRILTNLAKEIQRRPTKEEIAEQYATKTDIAEVNTGIAELRAEMKSDHAQMTIRFMTAVIASTMLNLTAIGIAVSVLVWFFGASGS